MTELRTSEALLEKLRKASSVKLTADDIYNQKVSFIMGAMSDSNTMTRAEVQNVVDRIEGRKRA